MTTTPGGKQPILGPMSESRAPWRIAGISLPAIAFLLLTLALILLWSHYQLMWTDEFYPLQNDSAATLAQVTHIQRTTPTSLDPMTYNVFAHAAVKVFGSNKFAIRFPSFFGYLLMQVCLYVFVRRLTTERGATFALGFPALACVFFYAVQARPYGLILGLTALIMLSWQTAIRRASHRTVPLILLAASTVLMLNTHFYGVLVLIPLCGAELFRTFERRKLDLPVVTAIGIGLLGLLLLLPFIAGAASFRSFYYHLSPVVIQFISHSFIWIVLGDIGLGLRAQHIIAVLITVGMLALFVNLKRQRGLNAVSLPRAEMVFVLLLTSLPAFGFVLGRYVTKVVETRYVLPAIVGLTALLAILLAPLLKKNAVAYTLLPLLFVSIAAAGYARIHRAFIQGQRTMLSVVLSPEIKSEMNATDPMPIYTMNPGLYQVMGYYEPDRRVGSRMGLYYSQSKELQIVHSNYLSMTVANMKANGSRNVSTYEAIKEAPGEHLLLLSHFPWDWTDQALAADHAEIHPIGPMFGEELVSVRFPTADQTSSKKVQGMHDR
jgi:hypothetical protein